MALLEGKYASLPAGIGAVGYFVGVGTICLSTPAAKEAALMSIMTMASHGRRVSLPSRCLRVEGI